MHVLEQVDVMPQYLPVQLTRFIGRRREITEVTHLLASVRLVTLTGPGGSGKTRLALQIATSLSPGFEDGVWFVALAPLRDPALVPQTVTQALGIPRAREQPALDSLLTHLQSKKVLVVVDNCEHLIAECARLAAMILGRAPEVRILATSREPLAIAGEAIYPVGGLACPTMEDEIAGSPQDVSRYDAIHLFVERTRAVLPDFRMTTANALPIAQICRHLDGLPLALELASARSNVLTPLQIVERLDDRFTLLTTRQRDVSDPRHISLRAAMDWSYDLLSTPEQLVLQRLSVFAGGCSLATAEAVCSGDGVERKQVLELLSSLVNKSLVVAQTLQRGEARYSMLETIRQYAQEKLSNSNEWSAIHDRHLEYFRQLAEETELKLRGEYQKLWLNWLEDEYDNIRAALIWASEHAPGGRIEAALRITNAIYEFWTVRDYVEEGFAWVERLLALVDETISPIVHTKALASASMLASFRGNRAAQMRYGQQAAALAEIVGDEAKPALAWALAGQAWAAWAAGEYETTFALLEREIQIYRELRDLYQLGLGLTLGSFSAMAVGKYERAQAMLDEGLPLVRQAGDPYRIAMALNYSGDLARCKQNHPKAQAAYEESIALLRGLDAVRDVASALHNLGYTCLHLGDVERAHSLFSESMAAQRTQHNEPGVAECLLGFAALCAARELPAPGARLLAAAVAIRGERVATAWAATRLEYEHTLALIHSHLTDEEFEAEQAIGRSLSLEQAVRYVESLNQQLTHSTSAQKQFGGLTLREREVAALIAQGKSNGEIATELVVGKRTIETHIANILSKLGFTNRAQIVRWALENGLGTSNA